MVSEPSVGVCCSLIIPPSNGFPTGVTLGALTSHVLVIKAFFISPIVLQSPPFYVTPPRLWSSLSCRVSCQLIPFNLLTGVDDNGEFYAYSRLACYFMRCAADPLFGYRGAAGIIVRFTCGRSSVTFQGKLKQMWSICVCAIRGSCTWPSQLFSLSRCFYSQVFGKPKPRWANTDSSQVD